MLRVLHNADPVAVVGERGREFVLSSGDVREYPNLVGVVLPPTEAHKVAGGEGVAKPPELNDAFRGFALLTPGYLVMPLWGTVPLLLPC